MGMYAQPPARTQMTFWVSLRVMISIIEPGRRVVVHLVFNVRHTATVSLCGQPNDRGITWNATISSPSPVEVSVVEKGLAITPKKPPGPHGD
jgi:hypothetical protein